MADPRPSVLVLANCTHAGLALALRGSELFSRVASMELFSIAAGRQAPVAQEVAGHDLVLTTGRGPGFGPLAAAALQDALPGRVFTLAVPFFSGLMPDMACLRRDGAIVRGVLGDGHSGLLLAETQDGLSADQVARRYAGGLAFDRLDIRGLWQEAMADLRRREEGCHIRLSDHLEARRAEGRIGEDFLTFSHPAAGLITHIAQSFVTLALGPGRQVPPLPAARHILGREAHWPLHPVVAETLGLPVPADPRFKSPDRMGGERFTPEDFARRSHAFFTAGQDPAAFAIVTPWYLASRIRPLPGGAPAPAAAPAAPSPARGPLGVRGGTGREIVMTHFGRSGSTVLAMLLAQHSRIHWLNEIFTLEHIRSRETYNFTCGQMMDMVAQGVNAAQGADPGIVVGHEIKLLNFLQNRSCSLIDYARAVADPGHYVHVVLQRRNTLRRIFSVYKAMQTKVYHVPTGDRSHAARQYRVDFANLADPDTGQRAATLPELIDKAQRREAEVLANLRNAGIRSLDLTYEDDIETDPTRAYHRILHHLGLAAEPAQVRLNKTSASLAAEVSNYDEVAAALRGSAHEWMLG